MLRAVPLSALFPEFARNVLDRSMGPYRCNWFHCESPGESFRWLFPRQTSWNTVFVKCKTKIVEFALSLELTRKSARGHLHQKIFEKRSYWCYPVEYTSIYARLLHRGSLLQMSAVSLSFFLEINHQNILKIALNFLPALHWLDQDWLLDWGEFSEWINFSRSPWSARSLAL